jgi:hypothetical protein
MCLIVFTAIGEAHLSIISTAGRISVAQPADAGISPQVDRPFLENMQRQFPLLEHRVHCEIGES